MAQRTLIVAAHPDDEVLGCGGTIAKLVDGGACVSVIFLADGVSSREIDGDSYLQELTVRRRAAQNACRILGIDSVEFCDFADNRMDSVPILDIVRVVEGSIAKCQPKMVITHHIGDINIDHRRTHEAVLTACRPQRGHPVKTIMSFEVPSSTEWQVPSSGLTFVPNCFVDVTETFERKMRALEAYADELRDWPHPRSIKGVESLNRWRGATIGVDAAEAFCLERHIV